jgi:hypothetical protein
LLAVTRTSDDVPSSDSKWHAMSKFSTVTPFVFLLACIPAYAVWEYSRAAEAAMYDGVETVCRPHAPDLVQRMLDKWKRNVGPEAWQEIQAARTSAEYREVLAEALKEARDMVAAKPGREHQTCLEILEHAD